MSSTTPTDHTRSDSPGVNIESLVEALVESERSRERVTEVLGMLNHALADLDGLSAWRIVALWSESTFVGLALLDTSAGDPPHTCHDPSEMLTQFLLDRWDWENDLNGHLARDRQEIAAALSVDWDAWIGPANLTTSRLWRTYCEQTNQSALPPGLTNVEVATDGMSVWPDSGPYGIAHSTSQLDELIFRLTSSEFPEGGVAALLQLNALQTLLWKSGANPPPAISAAVQPQIAALIEAVVADLPDRPAPSADEPDLDPLSDTSIAGALLRGHPELGKTHPQPVLIRLIKEVESMITSSVYDDDDVPPTPTDVQAHTMNGPATVPAVHRWMSMRTGPHYATLNRYIGQLDNMQHLLLSLSAIRPDTAKQTATSDLHVQSVMQIDHELTAMYGRAVANQLIEPIYLTTQQLAYGRDTDNTTAVTSCAETVRDDLARQARTYTQTTLLTLKEWRDAPPTTVSGLAPAIRQTPATDPVLSGRHAATPPTTNQKGTHR